MILYSLFPFFFASAITNIEKQNEANGPEIWFPKLSKSEQSAYNKDVNRHRSTIKPKARSNNPLSIGEIHGLIRASHAIRRRTLSQKQNLSFEMKVLEYQEIFHQEAVRKILFHEICYS